MGASSLPRLEDADLAGKRVLVRADLNVPLDGGRVADDFRVRAFLPTLGHLVEQGCRVVVCSHLGRPGGPDDRYRMAPVAAVLAGLAGRGVIPVGEVVGPEAEEAVGALDAGAVALLENLRFHPGETSNDPGLADALAGLADVYVNDAFGASHRAHASIVGVPGRLPAAAGLLLAAEVDTLGRLLAGPERPYVVVLGGAKVSDKIGVVRNLLDRTDRILIGGGMCFTFLKARGASIGDSLVDADQLDDVRDLLDEADDRIALPTDVACGEGPDATEATAAPADAIPDGLMGLDIGPETAERFGAEIREAGTVLWNGPMGVFENDAFAAGTRTVAEAVAACPGFTATGGGDTAAALAALGLDGDVDFLSTGGGASLEFLEGSTLPGIEALERARRIN